MTTTATARSVETPEAYCISPAIDRSVFDNFGGAKSYDIAADLFWALLDAQDDENANDQIRLKEFPATKILGNIEAAHVPVPADLLAALQFAAANDLCVFLEANNLDILEKCVVGIERRFANENTGAIRHSIMRKIAAAGGLELPEMAGTRIPARDLPLFVALACASPGRRCRGRARAGRRRRHNIHRRRHRRGLSAPVLRSGQRLVALGCRGFAAESRRATRRSQITTGERRCTHRRRERCFGKRRQDSARLIA